MSNEIIQKALESSNSNLLLEVYIDLLKPGVSQVGKAIGTILGLGNTLLMPLALKNEKSKITIQNNLDKYRKKLKEIPSEDIQSVIPEIGVPILEKLMYVSDDTLVDLYTELLTKASDKTKSNVTHPSFVNIINNISPKEALILEEIYHNSLALVDVTVVSDGNSHPIEQISELVLKESLFDENFTAHISNLIGLGLIELSFDKQFKDSHRYEILEQRIKDTYSSCSIDLKGDLFNHLRNGDIKFARGSISISKFGELFLSACTDLRKKTEFYTLLNKLTQL